MLIGAALLLADVVHRSTIVTLGVIVAVTGASVVAGGADEVLIGGRGSDRGHRSTATGEQRVAWSGYPATASCRWGSTQPGRGKWQVYPFG